MVGWQMHNELQRIWKELKDCRKKKENLLSGYLRPCQYLKQAISPVLQCCQYTNLLGGQMDYIINMETSSSAAGSNKNSVEP
jgi:hypothetical protein